MLGCPIGKECGETGSPAAPPADRCRLYIRSNRAQKLFRPTRGGKRQNSRRARKAAKSLVVRSSFPHGGAGAPDENVDFVIWGLYSRTGRPYNPLIAEERGAKRRRARRQDAETEKKFSRSRLRVSGSPENRNLWLTVRFKFTRYRAVDDANGFDRSHSLTVSDRMADWPGFPG